MKCGRCQPDYCACQDFYDGFRAFHRGEYDHLLPAGVERRVGRKKGTGNDPRPSDVCEKKA